MKLRIILSIGALLVGSIVVLASLASAHQVSSSSGTAAQKLLYWDRPIGPDHSLYWLVMANDRLTLETASPEERIYLEVEYAHDRLAHSQQLFETDAALAASTLIKAEKYLLQAGQEYFELDEPSSQLLKLLTKAYEYHQAQVTRLADQVPPDQRQPLTQLRNEHRLMQQRLLEVHK